MERVKVAQENWEAIKDLVARAEGSSVTIQYGDDGKLDLLVATTDGSHYLFTGEYIVLNDDGKLEGYPARLPCPVHGTEMWWDHGEPGWYCADCNLWRDAGEVEKIGECRWIPVPGKEKTSWSR